MLPLSISLALCRSLSLFLVLFLLIVWCPRCQKQKFKNENSNGIEIWILKIHKHNHFEFCINIWKLVHNVHREFIWSNSMNYWNFYSKSPEKYVFLMWFVRIGKILLKLTHFSQKNQQVYAMFEWKQNKCACRSEWKLFQMWKCIIRLCYYRHTQRERDCEINPESHVFATFSFAFYWIITIK